MCIKTGGASVQNDEKIILKLAKECAAAFCEAGGIGCTVTNTGGEVLAESGYGLSACEICTAAKVKKEQCKETHIYGMAQAERFGGKYIYFCQMGLACFVSPIFAGEGGAARITAGPLLMVDIQDYIDCELAQMEGLTSIEREQVIRLLHKLPNVPVQKVNSLSTLLFMATGFMNNIYEANRMLSAQEDGAIQGQVSAYITQLKGGEGTKPYPFDTERNLLNCVASADRQGAQKHLNELFGYIFFSSGGKFEAAKARIYELLVLISRTAIDSGADSAYTLELTQSYMNTIANLTTADELCNWLAQALNKFVDSIFGYMDEKHADVMRKADMYLRAHCTEKIRLEDVANMVYLSPAYFSRIFKREKGETFTKYVNRLRIEKSKPLLLKPEMRMSDIAQMMGFEDQSYYTKVFKSVTGVSPLRYKEAKGRI